MRKEQREESSPENTANGDSETEPECASSHLTSTKDNITNVLEQSSSPVRPALPDKPHKMVRPTVGTDKRKEHSVVKDEDVKLGNNVTPKEQSLGSNRSTFQQRAPSELKGNPGNSPDFKGSSPPSSHTTHVTTQASSTTTSLRGSVSQKEEKRQTMVKPPPAPKPLSLSSSTSTEEGNLKLPETKHPANLQPSGSGRVDALEVAAVAKLSQTRSAQLRERTGSGSRQFPSKNVENGLQTTFKTQGPTRSASLGRYPHNLRTSVVEEDGRTHLKSGGSVRSDSMSRLKVQERKRESGIPQDPDLLQLLSQLQECAAASDYYSLLGVDPSATGADLAKARRDKSRELHPDHFGGNHEQRAR